MSQANQYELWKITLGELDEKMGVEVLEESADSVVARMPIDGNRQSLGLLHGGAMLALGEAVGSWGAVIHASSMGKAAVGVDVNATHHKSSTDGYVRAVSTAIHRGRSLATYEVIITHEETGARLCTLRITNFIK